jgi:hypothetical protein
MDIQNKLTPNTMTPGKYYEVKFPESTYLCKAIANNEVKVNWSINNTSGYRTIERSLTGGVWGNIGMREISYKYYKSGEEPPPENNQSAKEYLDKEW